MVTQFDSLDDLYARTDQLKPRTKKLLAEQKDNAYLSYKLFLLHYQKTNNTKDDYLFQKANYHRASPLFKELEFYSLLKEIAADNNALQNITSAQTQESKVAYWQKLTRCIMNDAELAELCLSLIHI